MRLALVDHSPLFMRGLSLLLPAVSEQRVSVVATTDDATAAAAMVRQAHPDLALVDLMLKEPGGIRAIAAIKRTEPDVPIVAMSDSGDDDDAMAAIKAGACGFLRKTTEPEDLVHPLLAAVDGWAVIPAAVLRLLLERSEREQRHGYADLSEDERRLWHLIASGTTTQGIARRLHVSERTAKRLIASLLRRLQVGTRTEAAALAGSVGLVSAGEGDVG